MKTHQSLFIGNIFLRNGLVIGVKCNVLMTKTSPVLNQRMQNKPYGWKNKLSQLELS